MSIIPEPRWLTKELVIALHNESISLFGGAAGIRDHGLLESALARPIHRQAYEDMVTLFELAASYGLGIAKNHAFVDGNKRTVLLSIRAFLFLNGYRFEPDEKEAVRMIEGLAAGGVDEPALAAWIRENTAPREK